MRINKFIALSSELSRRAADAAIADGRVTVNRRTPENGQDITDSDVVTLDGKELRLPQTTTTIMLNKPVGYVVSREGQGSETIYELLPPELHKLKPVGRLDKYSSGLLLLTNDGARALELTHPRYQKTKVYEVLIDKALAPLHRQMISDHGIQLEDGRSKLQLERMKDGNDKAWIVTMSEGRNRQIRRTFESLGYRVSHLHRTHFGPYRLGSLAKGSYNTL